MKQQHLILLAFIFVMPILVGFSSTSNQNEFSSKTAEIKFLLNKMIFVKGEKFTAGQMDAFDFSPTEGDSTLLSPGTPHRMTVESFYMSATEVTNAEWKKFYQEKVAELGIIAAKKKYYPDTARWINEYKYSYNKPHAEHYFTHEKFNNFPVTGISWEQATDYCKWKSLKINELLQNKGVKQKIEFRLPTEAEWELAAKENPKEELKKQHSYAWPRDISPMEVCKVSNTGQVLDLNNIVLKNYADDGCLYTCEVGSYSPNEKGIYNMAGNVSEWTQDQAWVFSFDEEKKESKKLSSLEEINDVIEKIKAKNDPDELYLLPNVEHNQRVFQKNDLRICKGGSWAQGMIYTQVGSRQGVNKESTSTKIGFRVAMSDIDETLLKFLPKKNWEPNNK